MRILKIGAVLSLAYAAVGVVAGCGGGAPGDKAGAPAAPVVLRMAYGYQGLAYEPALADFVSRVSRLSHGRMVIRVMTEWGHQTPSFEQQIVHDVARGRVDLGAVGTRSFDTVGVHSFDALTAPMLIDDYALERAVLAGAIPRRMLRGLGPAGLTGLAVLGDGLAKPIGVTRPLLGPETWRGLTFAAVRSRGHEDAVQALGARTSDQWGAGLLSGITTGEIGGFEKTLRVYRINAMTDAGRYVTANVNLWPQTLAVVTNPSRFRDLTDTQRGWLQQAATQAAAHSTDQFDHDADELRVLCSRGARVSTASPEDLAGLRRAFAPLYERLQRNAATRGFIAAIAALKRDFPARAGLAVPRGCASHSAADPSAAGRPTDPAALNGVYRVSWSEQQLRAAGAGQVYAHGNRGVLTLTLTDGRYRVHTPGLDDCVGDYRVTGRTVSLVFNPPCQGAISARWSLRGDLLDFDDVQATDGGDRVTFGIKPWRKIG